MGDENASMYQCISMKESFCPSIYVDAINNKFGLKINDYRPSYRKNAITHMNIPVSSEENALVKNPVNIPGRAVFDVSFAAERLFE